MKFALVNPAWSFDGSIYFGCREPHLPLEFGYARALLERDGHDVRLFDGQLHGVTLDQIADEIAAFAPERLVITTAPSYLFWRCAPPELRVPQQLALDLREVAPALVAVGPHASTTPSTTLQKLDADAVVVGECEDILPKLAAPRHEWSALDSVCTW